ncbi:gluconeogenesis factor YvcK family protein [Kurthia massiliensis]|uniref:gluconeogenesis factor YvcK family protein n=1 Tax=Kurthia massiliensis TaxID=1033739 RepID=UPI000288AE6B|nr:YvcK family protein [Kurthia massiliensis]
MVNKKRVVIIGGGTGLSTLIRGLKQYPLDLTAIVTVADDGGSSGRLRDDYDIPPPGDVRNVIAAMSEVEPLVEEMFQYRFQGREALKGHSLGNLMLTALTEITGDFSHAIRELSRVLNVHGRVIPVVNESMTLLAEFEDGSIIEGESVIPKQHKQIKQVFLKQENLKPLPDAIEAIEEADLIIIGPGSLYTSIIPNFLVKDIRDAVIAAKGRKVYICNLMTQDGETSHYTAADHVQAIYDHVGTPFIETILLNNHSAVPRDVEKNYQQQAAEPVIFDIERLQALDIEVIQADIATIKDGTVRHKAIRVAEWLYNYTNEERV